MEQETLQRQAALLEQLLPQLMRHLFALDPEHPAMELPLAQLRVCTILQSGPRSISALGEELDTSVSAVTQIADRLERAGFVERVAEPDDRRMKKLQLTPHGAEVMRSRREARVRRAQQALATLSPESREAALHAVRVLLDAGRASAPPIARDETADSPTEQRLLETTPAALESARSRDLWEKP
jgi:DNA-binding MarR family transcriptional regulator